MPALTKNPDGSLHVHCYKRKRNTETYLCADPLCTHSRHREELVGKMCLCNKCRKASFVLTWKLLRMAGPVCEQCSQTNAAKEKRARQEQMGQILGGVIEELF